MKNSSLLISCTLILGWFPIRTQTTCPPISPAILPIIENFESLSGVFQQDTVVFCNSTYKWSYETSHPGEGRLRFGVSGFASTGSSAATLDKSIFGGALVTNHLIMTADLSRYTSNSHLELEFSYMHHREQNHANDRVWIRGSSTDAWVQIYDLYANQGVKGVYKHVLALDVDSTLANSHPPQRVSSTFQLRFGQEDHFRAQRYYNAGYSFDNIAIREIQCARSSSLILNAIGPDTALVSWTIGGGNVWIIEWGTVGFTQGSGTFDTITTNSHALKRLAPYTTYDFYVRDSCLSSRNSLSLWSHPTSFTTLCASLSPVTLPLFEGFELASDTYQQSRDVLCEPTYKWSYETPHPHAGRLRFGVSGFANTGNSAATLDRVTNNGPQTINYLILTANLSNYSTLSNLELGFNYVSHNAAPYPNNRVWVRGSKYEPWVLVYDLDVNQGIAGVYNHVLALDIDSTLANASPSQRVSSTFQVRFGQEGYHIANTISTSHGYSFDNIAIREISCPISTALMANNITDISASAGWTTGSASNWNLEYGSPGFRPGSGTGTFVYNASNPYTLSGLVPNTSYNFYIQDSCGVGNVSLWSGPYSFVTFCTSLSPVTLPIIEGFESASGTYQQNRDVLCEPTYKWSYETSHPNKSRLRFGVSGFANTGNSAATLDRVWASISPQTIHRLIITADLSNYTSNNHLELEFSYVDHDRTHSSNDKVWIRGNHTDNWVEIYDLDANQGPTGVYNHVLALDIDSTLANASPSQRVSSTFQLRFGFEILRSGHSFGRGYSFDDIAIRETCPSPTKLTATQITQTSATLSWAAGGASNWDLEYGLSGFTLGRGTQIHTTIPSYTVSSLTSGMGYDFYVRSTCWAGPDTFTTLSATLPCPASSSLGATQITQTNATLSWMSGGTSTFNWNLEWGIVNFALGSGNFLPNVAPTHYTLSGLIPGTSYQFYVRDSCGVGHVSSWAGPYTFTTLSATLPCPAPSSLLASNITQTSATLSWIMGGTSTSNWDLEYGLLGFTLGSGTRISTITPSYTVSGLTPGQSYQFYVRDSCGVAHVSSWAGPDAFTTFWVTLPCPVPSSLLASNITQTSATLSWIMSGTSTSNWDLEYGLLGFTLGSGTRISTTTPSYAVSGLTSGQFYQFYVRDSCGVGHVSSWAGPYTFTTLSATLPCPTPSSLLATQITQNSARLSWMSGGISISNNWDLEYGLLGFTLGSGTRISTTTPSYTVSGLTPGQSYQFYVRDSCGAAHVSSWAGPHTFTTLSITLPCPSPSLLGTSNITQTTAALSWVTGGAANWNMEYGIQGFTPGSGTFVYNVPNPYTLSGLTPGTDYDFYIRDSCGVGHVSSWAGPHTFRTLGCLAPTGLRLDIITEITATVSWTSGGASNWNIEYGPINFPLGSGIFLYNVSSPRILRGLMPNTFYDVYVQDSCNVGNVSNWVGPLSIKTVIGIDELLERSFRIYPNPSEGAFNLEFSSSLGEDMEIRITNMMGQIVLEDEIESFSGSYRKRLEMGAYRSGVYLLQLITEKATVNRRIILQ